MVLRAKQLETDLRWSEIFVGKSSCEAGRRARRSAGKVGTKLLGAHRPLPPPPLSDQSRL